MELKSTHNSATGEPSLTWRDALLTPFARCQSLTIAEQLRAGVTYFDIRAALGPDGWHCAHGLWLSRTLLRDVLDLIDWWAWEHGGTYYVSLTLERGSDDLARQLLRTASGWKQAPAYRLTYLAGKAGGGWHVIEEFHPVAMAQGFDSLGRGHWRTLLPVPRLWAALRPAPVWSENIYLQVDFIGNGKK